MHDVLVVGGGIAGLRAAIAAKSPATSVALITQSHPARSYSVTIQDGINAPESDDGWVAHVADTLAAGAGLNTTSMVESVCREAPELVAELDRMGVPFSRKGTTIDRVQLPGSRQEFTAYVNDSTGLAITQTLYEQAIGAEITIYNEWVVTSLIVEGGRCVGVVALDLATGDLQTFEAKAVVLATGGPRRAFRTEHGLAVLQRSRHRGGVPCGGCSGGHGVRSVLPSSGERTTACAVAVAVGVGRNVRERVRFDSTARRRRVRFRSVFRTRCTA